MWHTAVVTLRPSEDLLRLGAKRQYCKPSLPVVLNSNVREGRLQNGQELLEMLGSVEGTVTGRPDVICL